MKKLYLSVVLFALSIGFFSLGNATNLHVSLPDAQGYQDVQRATNGQSELTSDPQDMITLIQLINEYLWIAMGVICMVVIVSAGIKLISARGDEAVTKKATNTIIAAIVGIVIAIFAYLIVRLALNLFQ